MLRATSHGPITRIHLARTLLGQPLRTVEAYLVDGLLVDSGPPVTANRMVSFCRQQEVRQLVNTHHHEDHTGGDALLSTSLGLPIAAPMESLPILRNARRLEFYRRLVWGQPRPVVAQPLEDQVVTPQYRFVVVPTPGHSPDHVCLFEPIERWLFTGDLFIHERARYLRVDEDARQILASLKRVLQLDPRVLLCSHAGLVEDGCRAVERKIAYWESLLQQARALRDRGSTLEQITEALLGSEGMATHVSRGQFSKRNLIASLLGTTR